MKPEKITGRRWELRRRTLRFVAVSSFLALAPLWSCVATAAGGPASPRYVGGAACVRCHEQQDAQWRGSHHDRAMQKAAEDTVLGDFTGAQFDHFGTVSTFFRSNGRFMVRTDGPDGELHDYAIEYTFGVYPLQQYLVRFPGGRFQVLDIAWDSRSKAEGGQRWFHLHPDEPIRHDDVLHWTGPNLNWNYMCASCHSTDLKKRYDAERNRYQTTWSEVDVSCEACHGPGADHVGWAERKESGQPVDVSDDGLTVRFRERVGVSWYPDAKTGVMRRSVPRKTEIEIAVCARCHSRRSKLSDDDVPGRPLLDAVRPALLTQGLYYADGQIEDEVFVYGSFSQSKMAWAGVTCSDCHDPHAAGLRAPEPQLCGQCHLLDRYATPSHHFHPPDSPSASCVECHLPAKIYMGVDARHDHSIRIPRPDLSVTLGTPNACNNCHADKTSQWALEWVTKWYGNPPQGFQQFAQALYSARHWRREARLLIQKLIGDSDQPAIARATALVELGRHLDPQGLRTLRRSLKDRDPLVRLGALEALSPLGLRERLNLAFPLLRDDRRVVRITAARLLAPLSTRPLPAAEREVLGDALREYLQVQLFSADRPESQVNLGGLYAELGEDEKAEAAYRRALVLQPKFVPASVNFAQWLAGRDRDAEGEALLRRALAKVPESPDLLHALGLCLVRQKRAEEALSVLAEAARRAPDTPRYSYVYAVALQSAGKTEEAVKWLAASHDRHPGDPDTLYALATFHRDLGHLADARRYARELQELTPGNPVAEQLLRELRPSS